MYRRGPLDLPHRQPERHDQPRPGVAQFDRALVKARDRGNEAEAEAAAGLGATLFQPNETVEHALAVLNRDAWTVVGDAEEELVALLARLGLARNQLRRDVPLAEASLGEVQRDAQRALLSLQDLAQAGLSQGYVPA